LSLLDDYLEHEPLPDGFDENNELYQEALRQATGRPLATRSADVQRAVASRVAEMVEVLYQRSFEGRPGEGSARNVRYDYLNDIARTEAILARPEHTWLSTYVFDARSSFHDMTLSSGLRELRKALEGLSQEGFMSKDSPYASRTPAFLRRQLVWDQELLRQAIALSREYESFNGSKSSFSRNLNESVKQAALAQFKTNLTSLVARAQKYSPAQRAPGESALRTSLVSEVQSFASSQELLGQLLEIGERTGIDVGLRAAVAGQASYLLGAIGREFESERFYSMQHGDFSWWGGNKPVSYAAFGSSNADELAGYLAGQRNRIAFLGRELAAPVYAFMAAHNISAQQSARVNWDEILGALDQYDNKQPGNSVAVLENFIRFEMDRVNIDDCSDLLRTSASGSRDFFILIRNNLRRQLFRQCEELARAKSERDIVRVENENLRSLDNYRDIEAEFNRRLSGRFPFNHIYSGTSLSEADPESILAFFGVLDKKEQAAREALARNPQLGASQQQAIDFLDRMTEVRKFFAPFLEKKVGPYIDFNVQFRVNQEMEVGANQIIDWSFDVGRKKYNYADKELAGRWAFGEPMRLSLRWANDSPSVPRDDLPEVHMKVRGRMVTFDFNNRWSVLSLLMRQSASGADFRNGVDVEAYTLKFRVPTQPSGAVPLNQPEQLRRGAAEVFMSLSLLAPGTKEPLVLPVFPVRAPRL
jgi:type VI secretion system protein ImpL